MDPVLSPPRPRLAWRPLRRLPSPPPTPPRAVPPASPPGPPSAPPRRWLLAGLLIAAALVGGLLLVEMRTSWLQSRVATRTARALTYRVEPGPSPQIRFPQAGPSDVRRGYARLGGQVDTLLRAGFAITAQARVSARFAALVDRGFYPIYRERDQAGLTILDPSGAPVLRVRHPARLYGGFDEIPVLAARTLLYIENRELLDSTLAHRNPAVEWDRFSRALVDQVLTRVGLDRAAPGGSTLATQLEKFRHTPGGRTATGRQKLLQMSSATLRSYLDGEHTLPARQRIVTSYLNTLPLAAVRGAGEVIGIADGLQAWYGADFDAVNGLLRRPTAALSDDERAAQAVAFRQVLGLILAARRPSYYLRALDGQRDLARLTDVHLGILARAGVIPAELYRAALRVTAPVAERAAPAEEAPATFPPRKAANAVRNELLRQLRVAGYYELDHYDLTVNTTFDQAVQTGVTAVLQRLKDPDYVRRLGFDGYRLVGAGDPAAVRYAVTLYEATERGNLLRVQADNFDGPFDINVGAKLELGSTAKLRTLVSYLQAIEATYHEVRAGRPRPQPADRLTAWTYDFLGARPRATMREVLDAALARRYAASPGEPFYTGGGLHVFQNFSASDNGRVLSVLEGLRNSVNLVYIRVMRDVAAYHTARLPGNPAAMLADVRDPRRRTYLARFADTEGQQFLLSFYRRYRAQAPGQALTAFVRQHPALSAQRLAWAFRSVRPDATVGALGAFFGAHTPLRLSDDALARLYARTDARPFSWHDRGYLAGVHPLELWLLNHLEHHPDANWAAVRTASTGVRQHVYGWLLKKAGTHAVDARLRTMLEEQAFQSLHRAWQAVGYPFDHLVPSYATAIGSSADRPDALAELVGIVARGGLRYPKWSLSRLHFAEGTPYETIVEPKPVRPVRVLSPAVAGAVRTALLDVVERGTARRVAGAFAAPDGRVLPVGGKTGTGDNRVDVYGPGRRVVASRPLNRTSTFVFFIDDRFFGTVTAYVSGAEAASYAFTSTLPVQLLKELRPTLAPLFGPVPAAPAGGR